MERGRIRESRKKALEVRGTQKMGMWLNGRALSNRHKTLGSIHNTVLPTKQRQRRRHRKDEFDANMKRAKRGQKPTRR